jgi:hypothetical protein
MTANIPGMGAANEKLTRSACTWWSEMAAVCNLDLSGFDPDSTLEMRIAWAIAQGYEIGIIYFRFSTKLQHSTDDQVRECIHRATKNRVYVPPELMFLLN